MTDQAMTIKLRLRDKCASELKRQARSVNFVWNYLNETSMFAWKRDRVWLSRFDLHKLTAGASKAIGLHAHTIQRVCQQFDLSRQRAKRAGLRWRGRESLGWVPFSTGHVTFDGVTLKFRGVHYQPMHLHPRLIVGAKVLAGSFNQDARGRWYVNITIRVECAEFSAEEAIGIDLGLKEFATLSNGERFEIKQFFRKSEKALATSQRAKKSKRVRNIHAKIANRRKDFLHKASSTIAKQFGTIVVGDVSSSKLAKTTMAKSVLDAGWSSFKNMLAYKAVMHGGKMIEVNEAYTTQTCSSCGTLPNSRPTGIASLGVREWKCSDCGTVHDRDVNAAQNILRVGLDTLAEGALS